MLDLCLKGDGEARRLRIAGEQTRIPDFACFWEAKCLVYYTIIRTKILRVKYNF